MAIRHLWESRHGMRTRDFAQVSYDDRTGLYAILTTDEFKPKVIVVDEAEMRDLAKKLCDFLKELDSEESDSEETYEKSEKDAMWERE